VETKLVYCTLKFVGFKKLIFGKAGYQQTNFAFDVSVICYYCNFFLGKKCKNLKYVNINRSNTNYDNHETYFTSDSLSKILFGSIIDSQFQSVQNVLQQYMDHKKIKLFWHSFVNKWKIFKFAIEINKKSIHLLS
jgi:hypothetical protein